MSAPEPSVLPATPLTDAIEPGSQSEDFEADCREAIRLCRHLERERAQIINAAQDVLADRVGELPSLGWLPDNDRTRRALGNLVALLRALGEVK